MCTKVNSRTILGLQHKQNTEINKQYHAIFWLIHNKIRFCSHNYQPVQLISKVEISFSSQRIEKIAYLKFIDTLFPNLNLKTHLHLNTLEHCHFSGLLVETFHLMGIFLLLQTNKKHSVLINQKIFLGKPLGNISKTYVSLE